MPLDTVNDIRSMDAAGHSRSEIARMLHVSRNTVAKYADMEDMSPAAPMPRRRGRPALEGNEEWVAGVLEADLGAPRKQRHTARRILRQARRRARLRRLLLHRAEVRPRAQARPGGGGRRGVPRARVGARHLPGRFRELPRRGRREDPRPQAAGRDASRTRTTGSASPSCRRGRSACAPGCSSSSAAGAAPAAAMVLDNATEAGRMVRGEVTESRLFRSSEPLPLREPVLQPLFGKREGLHREPPWGSSGATSSSPCLRSARSPKLNAFLAEGCARVNAAARCRDGRPHGEAYREDLAAMRALPGVEFDAVRWVTARADKRGYVEADGREYVAGPAWHGRSLLVGMRASTVEIIADRGRRVAVLPGPSGRAPRIRTPSRSCPPSSPGRGPSGSRRSGATCRRGSSR